MNMGKTLNPDGTYSVTVESAECGTFYSTHRITLRPNDEQDCGRYDTWVRTGVAFKVVVCLEQD